MAKLTTLKPRLTTMNTFRVKPMASSDNRVTGRERVRLKRMVYQRDGGRCCLCNRIVSLGSSEMDHRIALQFGGDNESVNLWTLCRSCHDQKSLYEVRYLQPLPAAEEAPAPLPIDTQPNRFNMA